MKELTIRHLQEYIKTNDFDLEWSNGYFQKLIEEVGELSEAIRRNKKQDMNNGIKGTIDEELYDVMYYVLALANIYGVDMESCAYEKEKLNRIRWDRVTEL
ncbi:hypothetical protein G9F71_025080 [Clostridium sp. FP2]|uniref:MazG nucleotide pyrophosphohydrolase domain-containing protein n=1 Tax=Clostridium sp. FP2 TaxID=2724481 RepID=UPI0013E97527|nr:MazG nucleotide pyrophosphohydrolase domain-containing protein [Clostridium sp. FP2]MBZ9626083.1 hypothetical protein [Clostridium sp. FP2]